MEIDERVDALKTDMETAKQEMQKLLLDMRVFILEAQNPTAVARLRTVRGAGTDASKKNTGVKADER